MVSNLSAHTSNDATIRISKSGERSLLCNPPPPTRRLRRKLSLTNPVATGSAGSVVEPSSGKFSTKVRSCVVRRATGAL